MNCMTLIAGRPPARQAMCWSATTRTTAVTSSCATAVRPRDWAAGAAMPAGRLRVHPAAPTLGYYWWNTAK
ncbi:MAG: hypothetical protein ACLUI3_10610 [Christensenellales bacterium]